MKRQILLDRRALSVGACSAVILLSASLSGSVFAGAPWSTALWQAGGGYWSRRVPITIHNSGPTALDGWRVTVTAGNGAGQVPLVGQKVKALRVCDELGREVLYDVRTPGDRPRREGQLTSGDRITFGVACAPSKQATYYLYENNPDAEGVADFLGSERRTRVQGHGQTSSAHRPNPAAAETGPAPGVEVGAPETLSLRRIRLSPDWQLDGGRWPYRGILSVINLSSRLQSQTLVQADPNRLLHLARPGPHPYRLRVLAPRTGRDLPVLQLGQDILIQTELPARSRVDLPVYLSPQDSSDQPDITAGYARLLHSAVNLVRNGDFEANGGDASGWTGGVEGRPGGPYEARIVAGGKFGAHAAQVRVAPHAQSQWLGWRQLPVPVKPNTTYFYAGWVKTGHLNGVVQLYGHCMTAANRLAAEGAFFNAGPPLGANQDWTLLSAFVRTPADCATVELHLTTQSSGTIWYDGIVFCEVNRSTLTHIEFSRAVAQRQPGPLAVWQMNPLVKVFPDDPPQARVAQVSISAARNEREPFELAVRGTRRLHHLQVTMNELRAENGQTLPPVAIYRVGFVPVDYPSSYYRSELPDWYRRVPRAAPGCDGWAGEWPDPLAPAKALDLSANRTQPYWFTVSVPSSATPGQYHGTVKVQATGAGPVAVPVTVTVWPFALPAESHLQVIFDYRSGPGWNVHSSEAEERKWYRLQHAYRINTDHIFPSPKFGYADGKVTLDTAGFDRTAHYCLDELQMNAVYTPRFLYAFGWAYRPRPLFGHPAFTPEYVKIYMEAYRLFTRHLRAKGWHDKFVNYVSDEPHDSAPDVIANLARVCDLARQVDPDMPCYSSTWRFMPGLAGHLNLWGIGQYGCFPVNRMKQRLAAGDKLWFTTDGQQCLDTPLLGTERLLPYYCFKYGVSGYEFWGLSWWTYDPWKRGWHKYIRQSSEGKKYFYVRYPNGDGYLTYPGKDVGVNGPVPSIRLEAVRDGIDDYDYLVLLQSRIAAARKAGKPTGNAEAALAAARSLVNIPNAGGRYSTRILPDPGAIYRVRDRVAKAIVELGPGTTNR